ncbi:MAG: 50S ribosomal protein L19 [Candidatus Omnitrophica bacterium CG07_land_8_20_14_0_80_42_15]|uniref:Large ribosomal subunit protein bL19 n=1 Tax=Candidatus Aquitaenariimonas noxiae TaxID=1974741 RepID=A0A2J0L1R8_9BACT|nr:MAG: 50S ribosomal protein L19 [Candidatus Omnitrophica bacterium CG07_land_8_20_14_0_80_42_15]
MDKMKQVESSYLKKDIPQFNVGDTVIVNVKIQEEGKIRIQAYEGTVIARRGSGINEAFTVRRISYGEGVERVFQLHSPMVDKIEVVKKGVVRRAKLYYLRKRVGKRTKVDEKSTEEQNEIPREKGPTEGV